MKRKKKQTFFIKTANLTSIDFVFFFLFWKTTTKKFWCPWHSLFLTLEIKNGFQKPSVWVFWANLFLILNLMKIVPSWQFFLLKQKQIQCLWIAAVEKFMKFSAAKSTKNWGFKFPLKTLPLNEFLSSFCAVLEWTLSIDQ